MAGHPSAATAFRWWICRTEEIGIGRKANLPKRIPLITFVSARVSHAWAARCNICNATTSPSCITSIMNWSGKADLVMPMTSDRFQEITAHYINLRIAVVGDFCLDRYFEIDPAKAEKSIETGLMVHNIVNVRCQPGAAGTILNNLVALGVAHLPVVGF